MLFALILEPVLHNLVLGSAAGAAIQENILLYGLYGGLAAGVFEETGRLMAFRFVLKKQGKRITALSFMEPLPFRLRWAAACLIRPLYTIH